MRTLKSLRFISFNHGLLLAIALGVTLRVVQLSSRELWYDEVLSLLLSTGNKGLYQTPGDTPVLLSRYSALLSLPQEPHWGDSFITLSNLLRGIVAEPHPPLFFLEQHFWLRLWGNSEVAMRSLGVLFSLGAIYCAYGLGRCLLGKRGGLLFAALLSLNPFYLFHSLNVRMYGSLVFWVLLSGWAWAELLGKSPRQPTPNPSTPDPSRPSQPPDHSPDQSCAQSRGHISWHWWLILTVATAAGLSTFYSFALWILPLALGVLLWERRRWLNFAIAFGLGIALNVPWWWWGTRQQLRNADLARFSKARSPGAALLQHGQDLLQTLGTHLLIGDWASSSPAWLVTMAGWGAIALLFGAGVLLWQAHQQYLLAIGLGLGIFPLALMVAIDVFKGQYTVGFGFGRSVIFVLPGCLLLLAAAGVKAIPRERNAIAIGLLLLYLSLNLADTSLRSRQMFHQIAASLGGDPPPSTLIAINSPAWGHVLRLAYYLPQDSPLALLAQKSALLPQGLNQAIALQNYPQILWLDSARPVWGEVSTENQRQQIQQILSTRYSLKSQQSLTGTWALDHYSLHQYQQYQQPSKPIVPAHQP